MCVCTVTDQRWRHSVRVKNKQSRHSISSRAYFRVRVRVIIVSPVIMYHRSSCITGRHLSPVLMYHRSSCITGHQCITGHHVSPVIFLCWVKTKSVIWVKYKSKFATVAQGISTWFIPCFQAHLIKILLQQELWPATSHRKRNRVLSNTLFYILKRISFSV